MTKEQFISGYCERSHITRESFDKYQVALPCDCEADICNGWAAVSNKPDFIKDHIMLYTQEGRKKLLGG